jgi:Flp pilus assembly protein TadD
MTYLLPLHSFLGPPEKDRDRPPLSGYSTKLRIGQALLDGRQIFSNDGSVPAGDEAARAERMGSELRSVLDGPDFARAPIMKRLLQFLVEETIAGRGGQLKAWSVAVDGLGRAPDYDAHADSYPRVQVGRLRRMLAVHYSHSPTADGQGIVIPTGRYRVAIGQCDGAQPTASPLPETQTRGPGSHSLAAFRIGTVALLMIILIGAAALGIFSFVKLRPSLPARPMLELNARPVESDEQGLRNMVQGSLLDGLRRSAMFEVRVARQTEQEQPARSAAQYRLTAALVPGIRPHLFLRLWRLSPDHIVWTNAIDLPPRPDSMAVTSRLGPVIAAIGRVDGVVAMQELADHSTAKDSPYSCLILYHQMRREHLDGETAAVEQCVATHLATDPDDAGLQAAAARLALSRAALPSLSTADRSNRLTDAQRHAEMATGTDPLNPWANVAQADVAVRHGACARAINDAIRASQLDPFDPALLGDIGAALLNCDDPRAEGLIRRAIALDDRPEGRFYGPLLLVAIDRADQAMAREALMHMTPPVVGHQPRFYLISAAGYAMIGDRDSARRAWGQLSTMAPAVARNPVPYFEHAAITARARTNAIAALKRLKLIA